ncbi:MAG TPA: PhnD/SsuA/transferrin family substrate-binding protein, partial [Verrucomicrobiota bacterium]|nr:PhnD/SsuA/transferrin family substrate-binding protein [Verrucomicrobiota bacterium]
MRPTARIGLAAAGAALLLLAAGGGWLGWSLLRSARAAPLVLVVADPLSRELACACVPGFGQRDYRRLARHLQGALRRPVAVEFTDDVAASLRRLFGGAAFIGVGERSTAAAAPGRAGRSLRPVGGLTGLGGWATVAAVFVARREDAAARLADLAGRRIYVGLAEADAAQRTLQGALAAAALEPAPQLVARGADAKVGLDVLDSGATPPPVAVLPEYVLRLLEGCGSITPGSLKVIGRTAPQPFITVFVGETAAPEAVARLRQALLDLDAPLRQALESSEGVRELDDA